MWTIRRASGGLLETVAASGHRGGVGEGGGEASEDEDADADEGGEDLDHLASRLEALKRRDDE